MSGWWNRAISRDVVVPDATAKQVLAIGSVKWRAGTPFTDRDLGHLAEGRHGIPGATRAALLAVCPARAAPGVRPDRILTPQDLLTAWRVRA